MNVWWQRRIQWRQLVNSSARPQIRNNSDINFALSPCNGFPFSTFNQHIGLPWMGTFAVNWFLSCRILNGVCFVLPFFVSFFDCFFSLLLFLLISSYIHSSSFFFFFFQSNGMFTFGFQCTNCRMKQSM